MVPHARLLDLQRSAGNQAVTRMLARYQRIDAGSAATADSTVGAQPPFTQMSPELTIADRPSGKPGQGIGYDRQTPASPPLNVADDGSLAINAMAGEAKEFYARPDVLVRANQRLEKVGSPIELIAGGSTVTPSTVPSGAIPQALSIVQPHRRGTPPSVGFMELASDVCRDAAKDVLGALPESARLGPANAPSYAPITTPNTRIGGTHQLAGAMTAGDLTPAAAAKAMTGEDREPGAAYGAASGDGSLDARAATLGVNQHARARIGEAYVTQSIGNADETAADHSSGGAVRDNVWYYHFGAVVAESLDAADQILLENYRRADDLQARQNELLAGLKVRYEAQLRAVTLTATDPQRAIGEILHTLEHGAPPTEVAQATAAFEAMRAERLEAQRATWYFRITGTGAGHSFHEQMAASGQFYNPLTMVVAPAATHNEIYFTKGTVELSEVAVRNLTRIANDLLHDAARGRPRRVELVGHSVEVPGLFSWAYTSEKTKRATAVKDWLLQAGIPSNSITLREAATNTRNVVEVIPLD